MSRASLAKGWLAGPGKLPGPTCTADGPAAAAFGGAATSRKDAGARGRRLCVRIGSLICPAVARSPSFRLGRPFGGSCAAHRLPQRRQSYRLVFFVGVSRNRLTERMSQACKFKEQPKRKRASSVRLRNLLRLCVPKQQAHLQGERTAFPKWPGRGQVLARSPAAGAYHLAYPRLARRPALPGRLVAASGPWPGCDRQRPCS